MNWGDKKNTFSESYTFNHSKKGNFTIYWVLGVLALGAALAAFLL